MLVELTIKNIALIESLRMEFVQGFNVLTGETGAGKSIVVDCINLALGGRADRDMIRIFTESVVSMTEAENLIVIKTLPASANVAAEAIDGLNWNEIAGTLAGENSIFVAVKSKDLVSTVLARFHAMMK